MSVTVNETVFRAAPDGPLYGNNPSGEDLFSNGDVITINAGSGVNFGTGPIKTGITGFGLGPLQDQALGTALPSTYSDQYLSSWNNEFVDTTRRDIREVDGIRVLGGEYGKLDLHSRGGTTGVDLGADVLAGERIMLSSWVKATYSGNLNNSQWKTYRVTGSGVSSDLSIPNAFYTKSFNDPGAGSSALDIYSPLSTTASVFFDQTQSNHPIYDSTWTRYDVFIEPSTDDVADGTGFSRGIKEGVTGFVKSGYGRSGTGQTGFGDILTYNAGEGRYRWLRDQELVNQTTSGGGQTVDHVEILRTDKYYQKGWARVELTNSDNETLMVLPVIQPYTSWATGEIQLKLYKGLNDFFIGKTLVVYDSDDVVLASAGLTSSTVTAELVT